MEFALPNRVHISHLFGVYSLVLILFFIACADHFFAGNYIAHLLPRTPTKIFLYVLIFGTPHVLASLFSFADREYLSFYRRQLTIEVPLFLATALLLYAFSPAWAFLALIGYTEYHAIAQQIGIGRFYFKARLPELDIWKWNAVIISIIGYVMVYRKFLFPMRFAATLVPSVIGLLFIPFTVLTFFLWRRIRTKDGRAYVIVFPLALALGVSMIFLGYPLLSLLSARIVHDGPAFLAYITHDSNRRNEGGSNVIYRILGPYIPIWLSSPVLALLIGFFILKAPYVSAVILYAISMLHYYIEGFIWKSGSIHRKYLAFV